MARMKTNAIRRPSPVFTTPREMKNAHSTSQTSGSAYPPSACAGAIVPVSATAATPTSTIAPPGIGRTIDPTMVPRKIARSRHALGVIPSGTGASRTAETVAMAGPSGSRRSRGVSDSWAVWPTGAPEASWVGGWTDGADEGGAGVTVIGPNMRRFGVRGQSQLPRNGPVGNRTMKLGSDPNCGVSPRRATLRGPGVSTSRRP